MSGAVGTGERVNAWAEQLRDDIENSPIPIVVPDPGTEHGRELVLALGAEIVEDRRIVKRCWSCKEEKPEGEFWKGQGECKDCQRARVRKHNHTRYHQDAGYREKVKAYRRRRRRLLGR